MPPNESIRCSIGTEPSQWLPALVLRSSILRRTSRPVEFTESWNPQQGWHPLMPHLQHGTKFSGWRFVVADRYYWAGKAIYLDADQVVLTDIAELWDSLPQGKAFAAVINAIGIFGKKTPEPDHIQTSVMTLDCSHQCWRFAKTCMDMVADGRMAYRDLMQAAWMNREDIHELEPAWNSFGICPPGTKLVHWSHVASQPYRNKFHPTAHVWQVELFAAIDAGHIDLDLVESEIKRGHLDSVYLKRFRARRAA